MAEAETYWKSPWKKTHHNERAELIRREERRKISHINLKPIQIAEITLYMSKAHNWKSRGNDKIQNYWLKAFQATHRHIAKKLNAIIEKPEKTPSWMTIGITYLIPKSGDKKEVRNYRLITCLMQMYKPNRNNNQKNLHTSGRAELTTSRAKRMSPWK
jgi:2-phosphoglycerate kinase